jgi:hypothetical protein
MQRFGMGKWEFVKTILFFSFYNPIIFAMDMPVILQNSSFQAEKIITIFDPKKALEMSSTWNEIVPQCILITPDEKGAIMSEYNKVRYVQFDTGKIDTIIRHCGFTPLIAAAQKQDGSLLIASAGNYHCPQEKKFVAEYVVYSNGASWFYPVDFPIQAISLNASGDVLAIADLYSVMVIDLNTNKENKAVFKHRCNPEHWIMDIAMNPKGNGVIVAGNRGDMQWMSYLHLNGKDQLDNVRQVKTTDKIKKMYYPSLEDVLYVIDKGEAKISKMDRVIEIDDDQTIDTVCFARSSKYNNIVADVSGQIAVACWTDNIRMDQDIRQKIKVYRKDDTNKDDIHIDKFILKISDLEESYNYRTLLGTRALGVGHILHVALHGKTVIALATDGKMRLWPLSEKNIICDESEKTNPFYTKLAELKATREAKKEKDAVIREKRTSSGSSSDKVARKNLGEGDPGDKSKKSHSFIHLMSRKGSQSQSREDSISPSKRDKFEVKEVKNCEDKI